MANFLITYDLNKSGQDYPGLYKAIKALGENIHPLQNVWFVRSTETSGEIRDALQDHVDSNDKIFVTLVSKWSSYRLGSTNADWLNGK